MLPKPRISPRSRWRSPTRAARPWSVPSKAWTRSASTSRRHPSASSVSASPRRRSATSSSWSTTSPSRPTSWRW